MLERVFRSRRRARSPTKPLLLTPPPPHLTPFSSPQGAVCSRNNRNNDNNNSDRPNRALRRPRPRTPAVKRVRDPSSSSPEFLDSLLPPPDTLLACSVRCVAQSLEGWHERDEDEGDIENIDTDDEGDV